MRTLLPALMIGRPPHAAARLRDIDRALIAAAENGDAREVKRLIAVWAGLRSTSRYGSTAPIPAWHAGSACLRSRSDYSFLFWKLDSGKNGFPGRS